IQGGHESCFGSGPPSGASKEERDGEATRARARAAAFEAPPATDPGGSADSHPSKIVRETRANSRRMNMGDFKGSVGGSRRTIAPVHPWLGSLCLGLAVAASACTEEPGDADEALGSTSEAVIHPRM